MLRLGGTFLHVDSLSSSTKKGESVADTVRCLESYCDVIVLRHWSAESMRALAATGARDKPLVNAGIGEHPTQALLDFFTIRDELGLDGTVREELNVVMVGDLKHGRTVHSLGMLLARSEGLGLNSKMRINLRYCSPDSLKMPDDIKEEIGKCDTVTQEDYTDLKKAIQGANVLYVTRIQRERFESEEHYKKVEGLYIVDGNLMKEAPNDMIVMHPLPRVGEITEEVDSDDRAAYFRQMENGMFVRMAILSLLLGKAEC